jgi:ADP-ribosylarginine hydrolase
MTDNNKLYYSMFYAIVGDTIGFGNGLVEFNENDNMIVRSNFEAKKHSFYTIYHIYNFISKGGYSGFTIDNLIASDDSILTLAVFDGVKSSLNKNTKDVINNIKDKLIEYYEKDKLKDRRYYGNRTIKSLERLINRNLDWKKFSYSENAGGCGASIRSMPIGLFYHGKENRDKLLEISIQSSRITHNNPTGYLGGFASALFTALAIEGVKPYFWIDELLSFFREGKIANFVKKEIGDKFKNELKYHLQDIDEFFYLLMKYKDWRFVELTKDKQYIFKPTKDGHKKSMIWLDIRNNLFYQYFNRPGYYNPGSNGFDSVIIAYDSILECEGSFEKLIYNAMLHAGDSDSTGCIAGALFGAYYGNVNIPKNLTQIELKDELDNLINS